MLFEMEMEIDQKKPYHLKITYAPKCHNHFKGIH